MKKFVLLIFIAIILLFALAFMASMKGVDFTETVKGWFTSDEAPVEQTDVIGEVVSGKYELVNFGSNFYEADPKFQDEKVVFGLYVENNDGTVNGYNVSKVTWERVGDVIFYKLGAYEIAPDIPSGVNLYADFGDKGATVSKEFKAWFDLHFKAVDEIPDVTHTLSGKYKFNDTVTFLFGDKMTQELAFENNGEDYIKMYIDAYEDSAHCDVFYGNSDTYNKVWSYSEGWLDDSSRVIEISETTVTMKFYLWFTSVTKPYVDGEDPGEDTTVYKIEAGQYHFNDAISYPAGGDIVEVLDNASWNGKDPVEFNISCIDDHPESPVLLINGEAAYYDIRWEDLSWLSNDIEVHADEEVSREFFEWFSANTQKVS